MARTSDACSRRGPADVGERRDGLTLRHIVFMAMAMIRTDRRTVRTFSSVALATWGLLLSFAAINGMGAMMTQSAKDIVSGDVSGFAQGYEYSMLNPQTDVVSYLDDDGGQLVSKLEESPGVTAVRPRITAGAQLSTGGTDAGVVVIGSDVAAEGYVILAGSPPSGAGEICVNQGQRDDLGVSVGDTLTLSLAGAPAATASTTVTLACVYDNSRFGLFRSSFIVMDVAGVQELLGRPHALTQVLLTLTPGTDAAAECAALSTRFAGVTFSTAQDTAGLIFAIQTAQRAIMWVLVVVMALICAVLVAHVVAFALRRQRGEIATLRAMGFGANAVRAVHATHTVIVGALMIAVGAIASVVSAVICATVGIPIGGAVQLFGESTLRPSLGVGDVSLTAAVMLIALLVGNLLSTRKMLRLSPVAMVRDA
ncbi:ABC transporter permease [uncultured Microbacterium sp.]|uniref:ABC transporter permease n=1 Tax=uncultured Microbacterium sp. TaxID=191216 RepID=UPI0025E281D0|nr:FtsX-like permease family protein [uncultured Microbacterium sp.]